MGTPQNLRSSMPDPFLNYRFLVLDGGNEGKPVAACTKVSALTRKTEAVDFRAGGDPQVTRKIPGQTTYEAITLERGLVLDGWFESWVNQVWFYEKSAAHGELVSLKDFRRDLIIQLMNQAGQLVAQYMVFSCWPSSYTALPELDATANTVAIETLELQNEGWQRDDAVKPGDLAEVAADPGVDPVYEVPAAKAG
jgi:phage tail-like protein